MSRQQWPNIKLLSTVKSEVFLSHLLAKKAIGSYDFGFKLAKPIARSMIYNQKMIAHLVIAANIAANQGRGGVRNCSAFLKEHFVTQTLRLPDFRFLRRQAQLQGPDQPRLGPSPGLESRGGNSEMR